MKTIARLTVRRSVNPPRCQWRILTTTTLTVCFLLLSGVMVWADPCAITNEALGFAFQSSVRDTAGHVTLSWESCQDHLYEVQALEDPAQAVWQRRALVIGGDGATVWTDTNAPVSAQQFFRVQRLRFGGDEDADGLTNLDEFNRATDLRNPDTDGDGMSDSLEVLYGHNPLDPRAPEDANTDSDGDGYSNLQEQHLRTKPNAAYSNPGYLPRNLVAWWKLDEETGTNVFDSSLNRHHGLVRGLNPSGTWTSGYFSNGASLGGPSDNWIEVPYHSSLIPTQQFTLTGWVKPSDQGILAGNWDSTGPSSGNYQLQFGPERVELWFRPAGLGTYQSLVFNPDWSSNEWHHLTVRYSGSHVAVFVDGEQRTNQAAAGPLLPAPNPTRIGFPGLTGAYLVDDVRLYNRALGTNEIASLSRGNGLPVTMIVGQTAPLRAFGASETDTCEWSIISGRGFFTNTVNGTTEFRPSWSGAVTVQVVVNRSGVLHTNRNRAVVALSGLSPLSDWNDNGWVQEHNNCYNYSTDLRTDTFAQPGVAAGAPGQYPPADCQPQTIGAVADGLRAGVDLDDLCHTSGLPQGHIVALYVWPGFDYHFARLDADGTWSSKGGPEEASKTDYEFQPILDARTADFGDYEYCGCFWVGPDVRVR